MTYYRLLDSAHANIVVRAEGRSQQEYVDGVGWVESGIMMKYFCDEDPLYDKYEEIPEEYALRIING